MDNGIIDNGLPWRLAALAVFESQRRKGKKKHKGLDGLKLNWL